MNVPLYGFAGAILILLLTIFSFTAFFRLLSCLIVLTLGVFTCVYKKYSLKLEDDIKSGKENLFQRTEKIQQQLLEESKKKVTFTLDRRVTGSHVIDESLQEILDFVLRDYVEPWYGVLTNDEEFTKSVRDTAQKIAINIANRVKDVDWIPYLTTKLVDDAASHMRLYRQARAKLKHVQSMQVQKGSSSSSTSGGTPKKTPSHRRNKSETDVFWYSQSKFYVPNLAALNEPKASSDDAESLEKIFFDMEVQMENNLICRDLVCTDEAQEFIFGTVPATLIAATPALAACNAAFATCMSSCMAALALPTP